MGISFAGVFRSKGLSLARIYPDPLILEVFRNLIGFQKKCQGKTRHYQHRAALSATPTKN